MPRPWFLRPEALSFPIQVLLLSMRDMNIAKLTSGDVPLFNAIVQDLFPNVELPVIDYGKVSVPRYPRRPHMGMWVQVPDAWLPGPVPSTGRASLSTKPCRPTPTPHSLCGPHAPDSAGL